MNKAIFFDKDGVINADKGIRGTSENIEFIQGIDELIAYFRDKGFKIFVVTNQPIVARGILKEKELQKALIDFEKALLQRNPLSKIDKIYYCPHHPNADVPEYRISCICRKPKPGMFHKAIKEFDLDCAKCYAIGDRMSDIIAGHLAGCTTIHFLSGKHEEKMIETDLKNIEDIKPDYVISNLEELRNIVK